MNNEGVVGYPSTEQRTPCMLVLDISHSMTRKHAGAVMSGIDELNQGLRVLYDSLQDDAAALNRVQLAIVTVGGGENKAALHMNWTEAADFEPPTLVAAGNTPLGEGMRLALYHLDQQKQHLRRRGVPYTRPWIMVITDGEPTDAESVWRSVARDCQESEARKRCIIYPIAVEGAKLDKLQQLSSMPVKLLSAAKFGAYFRWLSASLSLASQTNDGEPIVLDASLPWESVAPRRD